MLFLIEYDRERGEVVSLERFEDSERDKADDVRLEKELELNCRGVMREVVLLEAATEDAIRLTHRRYFKSISELSERLSEQFRLPPDVLRGGDEGRGD